MIEWEEISQTFRCATCGNNAQMSADDLTQQLGEVRCEVCDTSVVGAEANRMLTALRDEYVLQNKLFRARLRKTMPASEFTDPRWPFTLKVVADPLP